MPTIAIVGAGLAGAKAAEKLREKDFDGKVVLYGAEDHLPYERPPLSKEFLAGAKKFTEFTVHDPEWYRDNRIDFRPGTPIEGIDTADRRVTLPDGSQEDYDTLLLATGSSSRRLDIPGAEARGVHHLRTIDDAELLNDAIGADTRLAVVGGGWIGLEVAAAARERGASVTVVESAETPLLGPLGAEVADVFAALHRERGVDLRTGVGVSEILTDSGVVRGLRLDDETTVDADQVLVAVGAAPNIDLAEAAGLATGDGGVLVDAGLQTSDPNVFAVGDIANAYHPVLDRRVRTEHWANALNQPTVAAANMLGGSEEFTNLPYFFTDQYDLGMEYAGLADGYTKVVFRGDVAGREFVVCWLDDDSRVLAGMQVNIWDQLDAIKSLITSRAAVDESRLADTSVPLERLAG